MYIARLSFALCLFWIVCQFVLSAFVPARDVATRRCNSAGVSSCAGRLPLGFNPHPCCQIAQGARIYTETRLAFSSASGHACTTLLLH